MAYMLNKVNPLRRRCAMRLNEDHLTWHRINERGEFTACENGLMLANATTVLTFDKDGQRCEVSSHTATSVFLPIANMRTNRTVGAVEIYPNGALHIRDDIGHDIRQPIPEVERHRITMILGVDGPFTANIKDIVGDDEDIVRLKEGHAKIWRPVRYSVTTTRHDVEQPPNAPQAVWHSPLMRIMGRRAPAEPAMPAIGRVVNSSSEEAAHPWTGERFADAEEAGAVGVTNEGMDESAARYADANPAGSSRTANVPSNRCSTPY